MTRLLGITSPCCYRRHRSLDNDHHVEGVVNDVLMVLLLSLLLMCRSCTIEASPFHQQHQQLSLWPPFIIQKPAAFLFQHHHYRGSDPTKSMSSSVTSRTKQPNRLGWLGGSTLDKKRRNNHFVIYYNKDDNDITKMDLDEVPSPKRTIKHRNIVIIGAGWGGLSAAYHLSKYTAPNSEDVTVQYQNNITIIEASNRVGGVVRDGYTSISGKRPAEAGQHGFWNNYYNIYHLLRNDLSKNDVINFTIKDALTDYAEQGQYSPEGIQATWPVYNQQKPALPTGLAQAFYTNFFKLPILDRMSAFPLVIAFSEFDNSPDAWNTYDKVSFRDLCIKFGVSRRCYDEAFESMILTGLFAPGAECSAAAALGMAYFFVLQSQNAFDVQWCRGNIGTVIFDPWITLMKNNGINFLYNTKVIGFNISNSSSFSDDGTKSSRSEQSKITAIQFIRTNSGSSNDGPATSAISTIDVDDVIIAVGAKALNNFVRFSPELAKFEEFRRFANLRGTSVLATRLYLDRKITMPYSANACWGFDTNIGMTMFDISTLHRKRNASTNDSSEGSIIEVDYYFANKLLCMNDDEIIEKVKNDLNIILGHRCRVSNVTDAAIVRLQDSVNWYYPGSYQDMPNLKSNSVSNLYFAGDVVHTQHGSWSQEKAYVTGIQAANLILNQSIDTNVIPIPQDEVHVKFGRDIVTAFRQFLAGNDREKNKDGKMKLPSLVDFLW